MLVNQAADRLEKGSRGMARIAPVDVEKEPDYENLASANPDEERTPREFRTDGLALTSKS